MLPCSEQIKPQWEICIGVVVFYSFNFRCQTCEWMCLQIIRVHCHWITSAFKPPELEPYTFWCRDKRSSMCFWIPKQQNLWRNKIIILHYQFFLGGVVIHQNTIGLEELYYSLHLVRVVIMAIPNINWMLTMLITVLNTSHDALFNAKNNNFMFCSCFTNE